MKSNKKSFGGFHATAGAPGVHILVWAKKKKGKKWKIHYVVRIHEDVDEFINGKH